MDYIYEELERQRLVMETLLSAPVTKQAERQTEEEQRTAPSRRTVPAAEETRRSFHRRMTEGGAALSRESGGQLLRAESAARLSAEEVSRAVERDARRYDGGYLTY